MENQQTSFDFAAEVGLTKHVGDLEGTEELVGLCHIGDGACVLDVGCGATEFVTSFPEDKQRAVNEYVRVTRPGGYAEYFGYGMYAGRKE